MTVRTKYWWLPTPAEAVLLIATVYFLRVIAEGNKGVALGVIGVAMGVILSRIATRGTDQGQQRYGRLAWVAIVVAFAIAIPFIAAGAFRVNQLALAEATAIALLGLNLITGYTGQTSLGHSAFAGIGAYITAILLKQWHVHIVLAILAGTVIAAAAGLLIGFPALRLRGHHLAIATLALGVVFVSLVKLDEVANYTGAFQGLSLFQYRFSSPVHVGWLNEARWHYLVTMSSLGVATLLLYNLLNSPVGRSFRAVRDNEVGAAGMGINVARTKLTAFSISAAYAGYAGGLIFILSNRFVSGDSFSIVVMIEWLVAMMIGGAASIAGSLVGALFLTYIYREAIDTFSRQTSAGSNKWLIAIGILVIVAVLFGNRRVDHRARTLATWFNSGSGAPVLAAIKVIMAVVLGVALAVLFRQSTHRLLHLDFFRGAITGALLMVFVLFLPGGLVGLARRLQQVTWPGIGCWLRRQVSPVAQTPARVQAEEVQMTH
jgi:branched-chain amino acid transport system permease protein